MKENSIPLSGIIWVSDILIEFSNGILMEFSKIPLTHVNSRHWNRIFLHSIIIPPNSNFLFYILFSLSLFSGLFPLFFVLFDVLCKSQYF